MTLGRLKRYVINIADACNNASSAMFGIDLSSEPQDRVQEFSVELASALANIQEFLDEVGKLEKANQALASTLKAWRDDSIKLAR